MPRLEPTSGQRMLAKTCLACGYRGPALQGPDRALRCPGCGTDLYSRPPKSYAELEGFLPEEGPDISHASPSRKKIRRQSVQHTRDFVVRVMVMALIITPPLIVVAAAGALAAILMLRG